MNKTLLLNKLDEIETEMRSQGLWKKAAPAWVDAYSEDHFQSKYDFSDWMQFIFLPNCRQLKKSNCKLLIPQVKHHAASWINHEKMLQLLVELDALL